MATGRPLQAGTIAIVSPQDAGTLIQMGKALPAGDDDPVVVDNREKDLFVTTRAASPEPVDAIGVDDGALVCPECGKAYKQRHHYNRHLKSVHGIEQP